MLNQVAIALNFVNALIQGQATFFVTIKGKKYQVTLTNNGNTSAPKLTAIPTLVSTLLALQLAGSVASPPIKIGADAWTISVGVSA